MPDRSRHVYFEDEIRRPEAGRTRGQSSRRRSLSTDRVHSIFDDVAAMQGRERIIGRDAYEQLLRENHILLLQQREHRDGRARIAELEAEVTVLQRENRELQRENRDLRRAPSDHSDAEGGAGRKGLAKLASLRKKYDRLEVDYEQLKTKVADWKAKAIDFRKLSDDYKAKLEESRRNEEDAVRRIAIIRRNIDLKDDANLQLQKEIKDLEQALDKERLRRRHF